MRTSGRDGGFTLIELMIVVAIIAIIGGIALPNLFASRVIANETAAIATLRNIASAQAQFQSSAKADVDYDGAGEYGSLLELSGGSNIRVGTAAETTPLVPSPLSGSFRNISPSGTVSRSGYTFRMYLPDVLGVGICPDQTGTTAAVEPDLCETTWCCYAWPTTFASSGNRCFMVSQAGSIVTSTNAAYSGPTSAPAPGAAFQLGGPANSITGLIASGSTGRDGMLWRQVD